MKQRRITREDVYCAIEDPDETGLPTAPGRIRVRWHKSQWTSIDVIYEEHSNDEIHVVTTFKSNPAAEQGRPPAKRRAQGRKPKDKTKRKRRKR